MHIRNTLDALRDFVEAETAHLRLDTKDGDEKSPSVHKWYLPPKVNTRHQQDNDEDFYPFILVRYLNDEDGGNEDNVAHFRLPIGIYNEDEQLGSDDVLLIIDHLKMRFKEVQNIGAATLHGKIEAGIFEQQKKPMFHGVIDISLKLPSINWDRSVLDDY